MGGVPILADLNALGAEAAAAEIRAQYGGETMWLRLDVTDLAAIEKAKDQILERYGRIDGLVNNATNNPKVGSGQPNWTRLENFPLEVWSNDLAVGLTGALLCARVFGAEMARRGGGSIVNIASDLALIGPDQRLYRNTDWPEDAQPVKPVSYSVVKSGLLGLTRYLATYWAQQGVRANALCPGGVYAGEDADFVERLTKLIPMGRMANSGRVQRLRGLPIVGRIKIHDRLYHDSGWWTYSLVRWYWPRVSYRFRVGYRFSARISLQACQQRVAIWRAH